MKLDKAWGDDQMKCYGREADESCGAMYLGSNQWTQAHDEWNQNQGINMNEHE